MELILWRHAEAQDGAPDLERRLTKLGGEQAGRVAQWLRERLPSDFRVIASPAARAQQTAQALKPDIETDRHLAPGASVQAILRAAGWPDGGSTAVVVGHQPDLGEAVAHLVAGERAQWRLKKGALWWIANGNGVMVRAVVSPDLL